ncbi:MAG: hypothetical protein AAF696_13045 [Bacteroidota bacterium]
MNSSKKTLALIGVFTICLLAVSTSLYSSFLSHKKADIQRSHIIPEKGCTFQTIFGETSSEGKALYNIPENVQKAIQDGLTWIVKAQQENGGWGAGLHSRQEVKDPHAVKTDPATSSMVAMALLRSKSNLEEGEYSEQLSKALHFILEEVESSSPNSSNITQATGTQIQAKLGKNIDVVLATQFLSNIIDHTQHDQVLKERVLKCLNICTEKIQRHQESDGKTSGGGWAGVLQSSYANNALETAELKGAKVDKEKLKRSKEYQRDNYDVSSGNVKTTDGAGVMLYSISSSVRSTSKDARKVKEDIRKAKQEGILADSAEVNVLNLQKIGYSQDQALEQNTNYKVYEAAKNKSQTAEAIKGFGNNGGEEFLSFLQTGESMIINDDNDWKKWFDNTSGMLLAIQNQDGSWNGHHCITSPVFCTATCLLTLSINNDIEELTAVGKQ